MNRRVTSLVRLAAVNGLVLVALLIVIEGTVSWFLVARDVVVQRGSPSRTRATTPTSAG